MQRVIHSLIQMLSPARSGVALAFSASLSAGYQQLVHLTINNLHSPKQRPVIRQNHLRRIVAGGAGDAAAGMGAGAAMIKAF